MSQSIEQTQLIEQINSVISQIDNLPGISIEVCGRWIWVSGDTKPVKTELRDAGFFWATKKKKWYWRPADEKKRFRGRQSMQKIREKYGSEMRKENL